MVWPTVQYSGTATTSRCIRRPALHSGYARPCSIAARSGSGSDRRIAACSLRRRARPGSRPRRRSRAGPATAPAASGPSASITSSRTIVVEIGSGCRGRSRGPSARPAAGGRAAAAAAAGRPGRPRAAAVASRGQQLGSPSLQRLADLADHGFVELERPAAARLLRRRCASPARSLGGDGLDAGDGAHVDDAAAGHRAGDDMRGLAPGPIRIGPIGDGAGDRLAAGCRRRWRRRGSASTSRLAAPVSVEPGSSRSRTAGVRALSACISPSTSSSGATPAQDRQGLAHLRPRTACRGCRNCCG